MDASRTARRRAGTTDRGRRGVRFRRAIGACAALGLVAAALQAFGLLPVGGAQASGTRPAAARVAIRPDGLADLPGVAPVMDCAAVANLDLTGVTDAPVTIQVATVSTGTAPYCKVRGTIAPNDKFVLRLPLQNWTQRYVQTGCWGLCGASSIDYVQASSCEPVVGGTIASATTDMGHQGMDDGSWAAGNPQAQIDFAYRGVHVTAQVAKGIIKRFYGQDPAHSYFDGCSDGGREGLMAAQRYPKDFDGIAAGAPANNMAVQNTFHHAWNVVANRDKDGKAILLAGKLPMIHEAVLAACDGIDGLKDGQLDDPRRCAFRPSSLLCRSGQDPSTCLSAAEAAVVRRLHDGAVDAHGNRLEPAVAHEWGSELHWTLFVPVAAGDAVESENYALSYLRYLVDPNTAHPDYQLKDLKFTVPSFWNTMQSSSYMSALDPELGAFAEGGGKLLLWHGWNDEHISPQSTLAYHHALRATMGAQAVDAFTALYLFPGMAHCGDGQGPNTFDVLTPVMAWVESGTRPGRIVVTNADTARTRPVYPYPTVARYSGTGSVDDAASFGPYTPPPQPGPGYEWVGERLSSHGYQTSCQANGTTLACTPADTWLTRRATAPPK